MRILRLAYTTQFLLALIAVFLLWSQVGGQSHLDLMPWYLKLCLGGGAAFAAVRATMAAVSRDSAWNGGTLKWCGILLALLIGCGLATFYVHNNLEEDDTDTEDQPAVSQLLGRLPASHPGQPGIAVSMLTFLRVGDGPNDRVSSAGSLCGARIPFGDYPTPSFSK